MNTFRIHVRWGVVIALFVNAASMLTPIVNEGDSVIYAQLAQHMVRSNNWIDLVLNGQDWLDKPHFPFWVTALFFKLGGVSAFTYILPGFLFHLLGAFFTYRIARLLYDRDVALLALLVYVSTFHLMYTSSAIKAEAFLTGCIMAACYYWLRFDAARKTKHLLLGALFSAAAVMTKGVFTLITIASGLVCLWMYSRQWRQLWSPAWLLALALTVLFTAPELVALYVQFDAHPEKTVFGRTGVSGIKFFVWDSQFGRFFNSGPITKVEGSPFYFVHVFLWAYLPWVAVFFAAVAHGVRHFRTQTINQRSAFVYLGGSFLVTFVLFSATTFQIDYYIVILFPFAAVLCAHHLKTWLHADGCGQGLVIAQAGVAGLVLALAIAFSLYVGNPTLMAMVLGVAAMILCYAYVQFRQRRPLVVLLVPVLAIALLYAFLELLALFAYTRFSTPYNVNKYLTNVPSAPIYVYQMDPIVAWELGLYVGAPSTVVDNVAHLPAPGSEYFLLLRETHLAQLRASLGNATLLLQGDWVDHKTGTLPRLLRLAKGVEPRERITLVKVLAR